MTSKTEKRWRWWQILLAIYLILLFFSTVSRWNQKPSTPKPDKKLLTLQAVNNDALTNQTIQFAYKEYLPPKPTSEIPVILLHGSPGESEVFDGLAPLLAENHRVIAPDLPGFGDSTAKIPDYSFRAHAFYVRQMMDELKIEKAHFVGFSMGGGVILSLEDIAPERFASLTMQSAIGVQEYELLGDYHLNHGIHGLQLAGIWMLENLIPHFGKFDGMGMSYARNFYDSDQRPLRQTLSSLQLPVLIIHGTNDPLVPIEAAREHARLIPQSEFHEIDDDHFFTFMRPQKAAPLLLKFFAEVENGTAKTRANADANRLSESAKPFQEKISEAVGVTAFVFFLLLALSTLVSEDLTCITAGVLAGQGRISLTLAIFACLFGIYVGDILLFLAGRFFGRRALQIAPFRWLMRPADFERASEWFRKRGVLMIFASRFIPGLRLPMYFAAGAARTNFGLFAIYFLIAVGIWTPILVGLSYRLGAEAVRNSLMRNSWWEIGLFIIALYFLIRLVIQLSTWRGRRILIGYIGKWRYWEFWSRTFFYPPVVIYVAYLALKFRGLNTFTCANPAIFASGFVGESKLEIYQGLAESEAAQTHFLRYLFLPKELSAEEKLEKARNFLTENNLTFPIAIKPDVGERGADVFIVKSFDELQQRLAKVEKDTILQEFADGDEFGVFYYRLPSEETGKIFAITEKQFPSVVGDGVSTLETLILRDERAVCLAEAYFERNREKLDSIPEKDEKVQIIDIGTHSRGAIFLDGTHLKTPEMEAEIDRICRGYKGFYFGRFDLRTPSVADFQRGENFKIVELNGVTSEATSIYDRKNSLFAAYRILFKQWHLAFQIGAENRAKGAKPTTILELIKLLRKSKDENNEG